MSTELENAAKRELNATDADLMKDLREMQALASRHKIAALPEEEGLRLVSLIQKLEPIDLFAFLLGRIDSLEAVILNHSSVGDSQEVLATKGAFGEELRDDLYFVEAVHLSKPGQSKHWLTPGKAGKTTQSIRLAGRVTSDWKAPLQMVGGQWRLWSEVDVANHRAGKVRTVVCAPGEA